ncbi:MAG: hypothetical protein ACE5GS_15455 [Kiloniellaceae bacterium]
MSEQPSDQEGGPERAVVLGGRYRIHPDKPLPSLDSPMASAVAANDPRAPTRSLFALVCRPGLMPRLDVIPQLSRLARLPMVTPVDAGAVVWPDTQGRRFVILFENSVGERVAPAFEATFTPLREDELVRKVIKPLIPLLKELNARMIRHRAIRAENLFYADAARESVVLGECVSAPPGFSQPVLYEPIDAAMAQPSGRGPGEPADDLYAFGVLLVVLLSGGNPCAGMSDEEIIAQKISDGSYAALLRDLRVSLTLMEPMRGLLCDDPKERWRVSNLEIWAGGRHLSPKQPMLPNRASRAIAFAGAKYWTKPSLSFAMGRNWSQAAQLVASGELEIWLRRSLSDEASAGALRSMSVIAGGTSESEDSLVARALMVLEPAHPIRYRGISARIDGIPQVFAFEFNDAEFRNDFAEFMRAKLPQTFLQSQSGPVAELAPLMKIFDMIDHFMERPQMGGGLERALYESNRGWPCQSPLIRQDHVAELDDLLPALDRAARRGAAAGEPVDAHIAAFCGARKKALPDRIFSDLNNRGNMAAHRLGLLRLLAEVQKTTGSGRRYPALGEWVAGLMTPVVESYHNRAYRTRLAAQLEKAAGKGDLLELLFLVDSLDARTQDANGFSQARAEYADLVQGIAWLEAGGLTTRTNVLAKSRPAATFVSAVISGLTIVFLTLIYVT